MNHNKGIIVLIITLVLLTIPAIKAQVTKDVRIYIDKEKNIIRTDTDTCEVSPGDNILLYTDDQHTFNVTFDNYDKFFDVKNNMALLAFRVSSKDSLILKINSPLSDGIIKYYLIGVENPPDPMPRQPEAPPRIIIRPQ